jgi:hypothetical protein
MVISDRLNLGSGFDFQSDCLNVDCIRHTGHEFIWDLNNRPWPWRDGKIEYVKAFDVIEHLGKLTKIEIVAELARITCPGAVVRVRVPNTSHPWSSSPLGHEHDFGYNSFEEGYDQPYFKCRIVGVQIGDQGKCWKWNRFWRLLCKWTRFVQTIEFELTKKGES